MSTRPRPKYYQDPPLKVFGDRVRALRQARGFSQMELSHRADRHFTFVSQVETGKRNVTLLTILKLGKALDVDPGVLTSRDDRVFDAEVRRVKKETGK